MNDLEFDVWCFLLDFSKSVIYKIFACKKVKNG